MICRIYSKIFIECFPIIKLSSYMRFSVNFVLSHSTRLVECSYSDIFYMIPLKKSCIIKKLFKQLHNKFWFSIGQSVLVKFVLRLFIFLFIFINDLAFTSSSINSFSDHSTLLLLLLWTTSFSAVNRRF